MAHFMSQFGLAVAVLGMVVGTAGQVRADLVLLRR
jgi:hypothetical protein